MSYLLFMDESGHDHKTMPYEVRGGVTLHAKKLWSFVQAMRALEESCFGDSLSKYKSELKGHKLLDKDRFKWAAQAEQLDDVARRKHALGFLNKGTEKKPPTKIEFTAYGQASLKFASDLFGVLASHDAHLFASAIPKKSIPPDEGLPEDLLRKDHVFLLERYFYFLEHKNQHGLLVFDETDKVEDRRFVARMERYFTRTQTGRYRASRIVPTPFFVASDMTYPVQAADICIYCLNWGFRLPSRGMDAEVREEIASTFGPWLSKLQFAGDAYKDGQTYHTYSIAFVPDPYESRTAERFGGESGPQK